MNLVSSRAISNLRIKLNNFEVQTNFYISVQLQIIRNLNKIKLLNLEKNSSRDLRVIYLSTVPLGLVLFV